MTYSLSYHLVERTYDATFSDRTNKTKVLISCRAVGLRSLGDGGVFGSDLDYEVFDSRLHESRGRLENLAPVDYVRLTVHSSLMSWISLNPS